MNCSTVQCPRCQRVVANVAGKIVVCGWAKRNYAGERLLFVHCEHCGMEWQPRGVSWTYPPLHPDYWNVRCPTADCGGIVLCQVADDHVLVAHAARVVVMRSLQYVECTRCHRGFDYVAPTDKAAHPELRLSA